YMRLLFARLGRTFCRSCGREVVRETAEVVARQLGELPAGTRLLLGFDLPVLGSTPLAGQETGPDVDELSETTDEAGEAEVRPDAAPEGDGAAIATALQSLAKKGFRRLLVDGKVVAFDEVDQTALAGRALLQVVVDRVQLGTDDPRQRL